MDDFASRLDQLEKNLQSLIEGSTGRLFPGYQVQSDLAAELAFAIKTSIGSDPGSDPLTPNRFSILVHPDQAIYLKDDPSLVDEIRDILMQAGEESGIVFLTPPVISIIEYKELKSGELKITAHRRISDLSDTIDYQVENTDEELRHLPENAFLIVDGTSIYQLDQPIVNIGRRVNNDLVLEDARVSRKHAQLRAVRGRYIIFDLGSSGGTQVNGESIQRSALSPGDVISLAGLPLVYSQDSIENGDTQSFTFSAADSQEDEGKVDGDEPGENSQK